jgi:two-component system, NarL family, sensor histidine kinase DevS
MGRSQREAWLQASVEITSAVLAGADDIMALIAEHARTASEAELAHVALPTSDPDTLEICAAVGMGAEALLGRTLPLHQSFCGLVLTSGKPALSNNIPEDDRVYAPARASWTTSLGVGIGVPFGGVEGSTEGVLVVAKRLGDVGFDDQDLDMLTSFASQAALARRLAVHRAYVEDLQLLEQRDRIARDLHDHVVQELFGASLTLQGIAAAGGGQPQRLLEVLHKLDNVVGEIRTTIFGLQTEPTRTQQQSPDSVRRRLLEVVRDAKEPLGFAPSLRFHGQLELITATVANDLVGVVREALSNTSRHAHATAASVDINATRTDLTARVQDNGRGIGEVTRRSGLDNLRARAERNNGTFTIDSSRTQGTTLFWRVPLGTARTE